MPPKAQHSNAKHFEAAAGTTEVEVFNDPHMLPSREGWEDIADFALDWLSATPTDAPGDRYPAHHPRQRIRRARDRPADREAFAQASENATPIAFRLDDLEHVLDVPFVPGAAARDSKHDAYWG